MKSWVGKNDERELVLRWNTRGRHDASDSIRRLEGSLPREYFHLTSFYGRENSEGQRYDVTVVIMQNDG